MEQNLNEGKKIIVVCTLNCFIKILSEKSNRKNFDKRKEYGIQNSTLIVSLKTLLRKPIRKKSCRREKDYN